MQKDFTSFQLPNTLRDSNQIPPVRENFILRSLSNTESMDYNTNNPHSIVRPIESDNSLLTRSNSNDLIDRSRGRSIIQILDDPHGQAESSHQNDETRLEAAGFDSNQTEEIDADTAYALQLQQEEYSRESLIHPRYRPFGYELDPDDESSASNRNIFLPSEPSNSDHDEAFAAYLQEQESGMRSRYRQMPFYYRQMRQRTNPTSTETPESQTEEINVPRFMRPSREIPIPNEDEDEDEDDNSEQHRMQHAELLRNFFHNMGHPFVEGGPRFHPGFRRGRRNGNLQDTEDDFGPEDYERLLQLDDSVRKRTLNRHQIDTIDQVQFQAKANNTEEENKCGICLELFQEKETLRKFPCHHVYHKQCADRWLHESNACPICRKPPVEIKSSSSSRHHPNNNNSRRMGNNNRNPSNRYPSNRNNPNSTNNHRRGPPPNNHQS